MAFRPFVFAAIAAVTLGSASSARASDVDDFALGLKDSSGYVHKAMIIKKFFTWNLPAKCWDKVADKSGRAVHAASFATGAIAEYAKKITGDDWSDIESDAKDKETARKLLEPMMDAFAQRLRFTVTVDGDDCDDAHSALWIRYWGDAVDAVVKYPPPQEKVFVNVTVSSKTRTITNTRSKDGTTWDLAVPKDLEAKNHDALQRPFRQLFDAIPDDLAFSVKEATGEFNTAYVMSKLVTFKVGKTCKAKLADPQGRMVHAATFFTRNIETYAKAVGADDWGDIESRSNGGKDATKKLLGEMIDAFAKQFSMTVSVEGDDCDTEHNAFWIKIWGQVGEALAESPPKAKKVAVKISFTKKAKDVTVKVGKDGATIDVTAPAAPAQEPSAWDTKIDEPLKKVARTKK